MSDWITLTPSLISETLSAAQNETLGARPNQSTALDPLAVAIEEATQRVRTAIRSNGLNRLSSVQNKIPPELQATTTTLALLRLTELWPLFNAAIDTKNAVLEAENTLKAVSAGELPITLPAAPEPTANVRRSQGVSLERKRSPQLSARHLRGL